MTQAFNLLFYDGLKKSFAHYYKNDLNLAQQIIGTITPEELTSPYLSQIKLLEEEATENKELAKLAETPKKYKEYVEAKLAEANAKKAALAQGIQDLIDGDRLPKNPEETEKLSQYKAADKKGNEYQWLKEDIVEGNETPEDLKSYHSGNAQIANEQLGRLRISMAEITSKPEQFQVWIPNAENLARKTRKETLENIHKMETVSRMPGLAPRKAMALKWLHQINTYHLQTMENPFSWHEYTGRQPERPIGADNLNLESWLKVGGEN